VLPHVVLTGRRPQANVWRNAEERRFQQASGTRAIWARVRSGRSSPGSPWNATLPRPRRTNQALCALLFLYREVEVLRIDLPRIEEAVRARRSRRVPTVLTRDEVRAVMAHLDGIHALVAACSTAAASGCLRRCGCG
jgi:hypothetical protein